jgi:hypothetical protein
MWVRTLFTIAFAFLLSASGFGVFHSFQDLKQVRTRHFDIIYSSRSRDVALYIASFADDTYDKVCGILHTQVEGRITVTVSDDEDVVDGYAQPGVDGNHIAIFTVLPQLDFEYAWNKDFYRYEFQHEMTHIISLNIRGPVNEALKTVLGGWVYPEIAMPLFMVEGITTSFESLEGYGRADHPYIKELVRQQLIDGNFKDWTQATGSFDTYPNRNVFYYYGSQFNQFIEKKYGLDKYQQFWHSVGNDFLSGLGAGMLMNGAILDNYYPGLFFGDAFGMPWSFHDVYGISLGDAWGEFKNEIAWKGQLLENTNVILGDNFNISAMTAANGEIFFFDNYNANIICYDTATGKSSAILDGEGVDTIAVSPSGKTMLVCRETYTRRTPSLEKIVVQFYDTDKHYFFRPEIEGVREAAFFNDAIVAIRPTNGRCDLVLIRNNGSESVILPGTFNTYYSAPCQINKDEVAVQIKQDGYARLARVNMNTHEVKVFDIRQNGKPVEFIRNISSFDGKIAFCYASENEFFKFGLVDGEKVILDTNTYSGGVFYPVLNGRDVYYAGSFGRGFHIMKLPENLDTLAGIAVGAEYLPPVEDPAVVVNKDLKEEGYNPLPHLLPIEWLPMIGFKSDDPGWDNLDYQLAESLVMNSATYRGIDSAGLFTKWVDPAELNNVEGLLQYNWVHPFANVSFSWENLALPVHFTLSAWDRLFDSFDPASPTSDLYYRETAGYLDISWVDNFTIMNTFFKIGLVPEYVQKVLALDETVNPYLWNSVAVRQLALFSYIQLSDFTLYDLYRPFWCRGWELMMTNSMSTTNFQNPTEVDSDIVSGNISWYAYFLPFILKVGGSCDILQQNSISFSQMNYAEYADSTNMVTVGGNKVPAYQAAGNWAANMDLCIQPLSFEIQQGLPFIPIYFNRLVFNVGYRAMFLETSFFQSAYAQAELTLPYQYGQLGASLKLNLIFEAAYAINTGSYNFEFTVDVGRQFERD